MKQTCNHEMIRDDSRFGEDIVDESGGICDEMIYTGGLTVGLESCELVVHDAESLSVHKIFKYWYKVAELLSVELMLVD